MCVPHDRETRAARVAGRPSHMEVEGSTLGSYLQPGVGHRRARRGANFIKNVLNINLRKNIKSSHYLVQYNT